MDILLSNTISCLVNKKKKRQRIFKITCIYHNHFILTRIRIIRKSFIRPIFLFLKMWVRLEPHISCKNYTHVCCLWFLVQTALKKNLKLLWSNVKNRIISEFYNFSNFYIVSPILNLIAILKCLSFIKSFKNIHLIFPGKIRNSFHTSYIIGLYDISLSYAIKIINSNGIKKVR